ncbi:acetoacetate--CoA ligase [Caballeronia glathei]|uniref:Acetoacetyl-CoA synthase n=1 Tax=Caballeronia glathei TaxID=60547 RepID=A0A069PVY6_9BURK|nr:acetoacetate--CoA ligase [Caballeronia glathei]KDR44587.1 acetoacetyl-CoA synthase [Caballeronia glathei]
MKRLDLPVATRRPAADAARIPAYIGTPERIAASQMTAFTTVFQTHTGRTFASHADLHDFSVREFRTFWHCFLHWTPGIDWSGDAEPVCVGDECEHATFFPNVTLNYADNLLGLSIAGADAPAITACHADGSHVRMTRGELRERVARLAQALAELGLREGDRVAGVMRNDADAVVTALAVTALGATLSTAAPEMGVETLFDRFAQLEPRMLVAHTAPRAFDIGMPVADKIAALAAGLPALAGVVSLDDEALRGRVAQPLHTLDALIGRGDASRFVWRRFAFNHPLFIMFSSGTTGRPKCIVHGAGGSLLEHLKEHRLHSDLRPGERMYFHTSCAWMMWNWQLSALASGVEIVTYDGPIASVDTLWRLVADERINVFGTSPAYLRMCEDAGLVPARQFDLGALRAMMSTGAVLYDSQFDWVHANVKHLQMQSISGGTDILGCFVLGNPNLPVYTGEAQCRSLALDVEAWEDGAQTSGTGQLVCVNPFPSRPLGFHNDASGAGFHAAYFAANPGVWTHGDIIGFSQEGSARLHGRSDGVLVVRGINVGPGEIYRVLNDVHEIREALVVQQRPRAADAGGNTAETGDLQRMVLLVTLQPGARLCGALIARIRRELVRRTSPAHVPDVIAAVDELPFTHNGKLSEAAARNAVNGLPVGNTAALRNPACLDAIRDHAALKEAADERPAPVDSREELERSLTAQWEKRFGFGPIGRDDNFFELGGHSLLAARLLADVKESTGRALPLATLLLAPTIAQLAAAIDDGTPQPTEVLVRMRDGNGRPLFFVHSVTGSVMECGTLVGTLQNGRPVYGLQALGLDGEAPPQRRVEEMAKTYVQKMRTVQPRGPYALVGYSFGGLIAFEIAQQLIGAGERLEMVCLLDTYVHESCLPWMAWLAHQRDCVRRQVSELRTLPATVRMRHLADKLMAAADHALMRFGRASRREEPEPDDLPPVLRGIRAAFSAAMKNYCPRPYEGSPILYVRAMVAQRERGDPLPLWRRVARAGLIIAEVSGDHNEMIVEPNVKRVAAALDRGAELAAGSSVRDIARESKPPRATLLH